MTTPISATSVPLAEPRLQFHILGRSKTDKNQYASYLSSEDFLQENYAKGSHIYCVSRKDLCINHKTHPTPIKMITIAAKAFREGDAELLARCISCYSACSARILGDFEALNGTNQLDKYIPLVEKNVKEDTDLQSKITEHETAHRRT